MGGGIGMRSSTGLNTDVSGYIGYLIIRIGIAFISYLALLVLCIILNPSEDNLPLMVVCACATLISTVCLSIACFNAFVKIGNAKHTGNDDVKPSNAKENAAEAEIAEAESKTETFATDSPTKKERFSSLCKKCGLTKREMEVFGLLLEGKNAGNIENELCISRYTAKTHISSVYRKTDVHSQQELIDLFNQENNHAE